MSSRQKIPVDVFVNNELNLSEIKVYGFDYDFTLARYNRNVQQVIYDACIDYLVKEKKVGAVALWLSISPCVCVDFEDGSVCCRLQLILYVASQ